MRRALPVSAVVLLILALFSFSPARAATGTYYFHGKLSDQADKQAALSDDTARSSATFNTSPPASGDPTVTQTTTGLANEDYVGNPLTLYWHGSFTGPITGQIIFNWWWTVPSPSGTNVSVTVFADPTWASPRGQPEKIIGRGLVPLTGASTPTPMTGSVFVNGIVNGELLIQVAATSLTTGNGLHVFYNSTTTPSSFTFGPGTPPTTPIVAFDTTTSLAFAPSTAVSAHFLGAEPQTTLERRIAASQPGRIDPNRIFVDWPLSSRSGSGQLSRSLDGGDSFRLLYDRTCAERSRPNCFTHGGGDTEDEVNLVTGNLLFADQEVVANEALASSTDHGDTFPTARQFPVTNTASGVDRQWLTWIDPSIGVKALGQPVEGFLSYHVPLAGVYVQAITTGGQPVPQVVLQILDVNQSGNLRADNTSGPARGWIYVPYRAGGGYYVASASAAGYATASNWTSNHVSNDSPTIFPWLNLDARGNLYTVWVAGGVVYLSMSRIDDPCNDPTHGGRPATCWTGQVAVSPASIKSAVFPAVTAGDAGRIAITYMGSESCAPAGASDTCQVTAEWNTYVAIITDALSLTRPGATTTIVSGKVNHRVVHHGSICTSGTACTGDRSLLDMIDLGIDQSGRVGVVFMDNNSGLAETRPGPQSVKNGPFVEFAKLVSGPSLLAPTGARPATIAVSIPENGRADPRGDATWPNVAGAPNLRSLDLLGASVFTSGADLVARLPLADASRAGMARDLAGYNSVLQTTPPADRLQYVFRFSTPDDVFHLSMEYNAIDGTIRFFGGKLDGNDALVNGSSTLGAGYHTDPNYPVVGTIGNGAITLRAPLSAFGLSVGKRITGANAFAMAGPSETSEKTFLIPLRTVDATPPFDATLGPQQEPPSTVGCGDDNVQREGGWHSIDDSRAAGGSFCRNVGSGKANSDMQFQFTGIAVDLTLATGPRGGTLGLTIDGIRQVVDLYRAPANPATPDETGRHDLDFSRTIHTSVPAGTHAVRISNDSSDPYRDMVYVDTITIAGGDILTPVGHRVQEVEGVILGTALAGVDSVWAIVVEPSATLLDVILETVAGTTVTIKDPSGKAIATATVGDGGVVDLQALADGAGTYALVLHEDSAGDAAFTAWEAITEKN